MSKSVTRRNYKTVKVELYFNPKIGEPPFKYYDKMKKRCEKIEEILRPVKLPIRFGSPYTYGARRVGRFVFELDEKKWLPPKKVKILKKCLNSPSMKNSGLVQFKIAKVDTTVVTTRIFEYL